MIQSLHNRVAVTEGGDEASQEVTAGRALLKDVCMVLEFSP